MPHHYASFWQRFAALWIDFFVILPVMVVHGLLTADSRTAAQWLLVPMGVLVHAYTIYGHGRFGQTVGKWAMGIRVIRVDGGRIGWREAGLRSSVDVVLAILGMVSSWIALRSTPDAAYLGVGWMQQARNVHAHEPAALAWVAVAIQLWMASELIVMLFNARRRSAHDFLAGTVVVSERSRPGARPAQAAAG